MESEKRTDFVIDLPPEYCCYRDEGCELAGSCLNCPLPGCIYDEPGGKQHWLKRLRDRQIIKLFSNEKKGIKELAIIFGISQRTVRRALKSTVTCSPDAGFIPFIIYPNLREPKRF